jgi:anti-anti-sigma regulatory factor
MIRERVVAVRHLPENFTGRQIADFFGEVSSCLDLDRPCLVLDCSQLARMDKQIVLLLLRCLEEAMKRNGDVRLAGVSPVVKDELKAADAEILFRSFETTNDAIASFHRRAFRLRAGSTCADESAA